jgi:hypothetical protein
MGAMWGFLQAYGPWVLLGMIFLAMQWVGFGCRRGHHHGSTRDKEQEAKAESSKPQEEGAGQWNRPPGRE